MHSVSVGISATPSADNIPIEDRATWIRAHNYSRGQAHHTDEQINTMTHMLGTLICIMGGAILVSNAVALGRDAWTITAFVVYAVTTTQMFLGSTLHHGVGLGGYSETLYNVFRMMDHISICYTIAGTVTAVQLPFFHTPTSWAVFGITWFACALGTVLKAIFGMKLDQNIMVCVYLFEGWCAAAMVGSLKD
ncbi:adipoR/Haemolysin-III-related protein, partial [Kipferlia bialata]|eukprot:g13971.t1